MIYLILWFFFLIFTPIISLTVKFLLSVLVASAFTIYTIQNNGQSLSEREKIILLRVIIFIMVCLILLFFFFLIFTSIISLTVKSLLSVLLASAIFIYFTQNNRESLSERGNIVSLSVVIIVTIIISLWLLVKIPPLNTALIPSFNLFTLLNAFSFQLPSWEELKPWVIHCTWVGVWSVYLKHKIEWIREKEELLMSNKISEAEYKKSIKFTWKEIITMLVTSWIYGYMFIW